MKSSCLSYPEQEPLLLIRASQLRLCCGNHCAAALLSFFEYWHNIKLEHQRQGAQTNSVAERHGDPPLQDTSLLQYHTEDDLSDGLLGLYGKKSIRGSVAWLVAQGFLSLHQNPNPRYRFDRTHYFLFHPEAVSLQLIEILETAKMPDRSGKKDSIDPAFLPDRRGESAAPSGENAAPIAEITYEISSEKEKSPSIALPQGEPDTEGEAPPSTSKKKRRSTPKPPATHRLPPDWQLTPALQTWAATHVPDLDLATQTDMMRDHEFVKPHSDWDAAWRNWMRRAAAMPQKLPALRQVLQQPQPVITTPDERRARQEAAAQRQREREAADQEARRQHEAYLDAQLAARGIVQPLLSPFPDLLHPESIPAPLVDFQERRATLLAQARQVQEESCYE